MRHVASELLDGSGIGSSCCIPAVLLLLCFGFLPSVASCPTYCLCASDIISCSGRNLSVLPSDLPSYASRLDLSHNALVAVHVDWISQPFERLATLVLSKNSIRQIEAKAFTLSPHLLHLDLSSNRLEVLNSSILAGLKELRELLLFGNQLVQINRGSFRDLLSLKRLYLSANKLPAFPAELCEDSGGPLNLTFIDLSYNKLFSVPVQSLLSLTRRGGIYLQGNPLVCDCTLLALLEYWIWKQYRPVLDFRKEYPCREGSEVTCRHQEVTELPLEGRTYQVEPGKSLLAPCPGFVAQDRLDVFWITPKIILNSSVVNPSARLVVLPNGTLEIQGALAEDSGTYACVVARGRLYDPSESPEVVVLVGNMSSTSVSDLAHRSGAEHFNTAFTTLASCVVSIILVLLYLYLTPCRCRDAGGGGAGGCGGRAVILCSDPREAESGQRRPNGGKRVAFLEPQAEDSSVSDPKTPAVTVGPVTTEGILKNGSRTVEQTLTNSPNMA